MTKRSSRTGPKTIRAIRFGENGQDYIWVNDFNPKVVVHPFKPELEGKDASEIKDPNGVKIFVEFAKTAKNQEAVMSLFLAIL